MTIKEKYGLSTDKATDVKAALYAAATTIFAMPDTHERSALIGLWLLAMAAISYLQVGYSPTKPPYHYEKTAQVDEASGD